jgi:nucleotidyltransferase substrate binding protein (TIGR01987 family)
MDKEVQWIQRYNNYKKALIRLQDAVDLFKSRDLSDLEKQGMIQAFEFTHELSWKTLKDFLENRGNENIYGSKNVVRLAFKIGIITDGDIWMDMIKSRNISSYTYDESIAEKLVSRIVNDYYSEFESLKQILEKFENEEC